MASGSQTAPLTAGMQSETMQNQKNNILLMTDAYKFSHHKQFPVSWVAPQARPAVIGAEGYEPPIFYPGANGGAPTKVLSIRYVPCDPSKTDREMNITIVTNVSTSVVKVTPTDEAADVTYEGKPVSYAGGVKKEIVMAFSEEARKGCCLPETHKKVKFANVDETKLKRGSNLNKNFEGGHNVSYYTPRAYSQMFEYLSGENIVFFGLQYFMKEYLVGKVVTEEKIDEADAFISRYMADVRFGQDIYEYGFDYTMFPRGDWEAMATGDYDCTGTPVPSRAGKLPVRIEALPEGTCQSPGVASFKLTNTHPRFYWLPNFLETLLVQVWYPMSVATQARQFRQFIQAYSILSQRISQLPDFLGPQRFTKENVLEDKLAVHIAQVFDLLDFGYRGVSSHETAGLGASAYYATGFEGSDTVAGARMLLRYYNKQEEGKLAFKSVFENLHGATSVPAAEHSTITSWADVSPGADHVLYQKAEYAAYCNMFKQYMSAFCISLVSDGFNIWNAVANLWPSEDDSNGASMRSMLKTRLDARQLNLIRPDSGEGVETIPHLLSVLSLTLPEHWEKEPCKVENPFPAGDPYAAKYDAFVAKVKAKFGAAPNGNPFRRFTDQNFRVLQGDGVALDSLPDMLACMVANGFCANCVHFGSGGGLLQKLNRDTVSVAFKCCAMYIGDTCFPVGKDPIAGGKKSYGGNPPVVRGPNGELRNRGVYNDQGDMIEAQPMTVEEFKNGCKDDELKKVFENGELVLEQNFMEIKGRAAVRDLDGSLRQAMDNLELKTDFYHRFTSNEAIAIRLAEGSMGSKWKHQHATNLKELQAKFPQFDESFKKLGISADMDTHALHKQLTTSGLICDKKAKKKVLRALEEDDVEAAQKAMGANFVLSL